MRDIGDEAGLHGLDGAQLGNHAVEVVKGDIYVILLAVFAQRSQVNREVALGHLTRRVGQTAHRPLKMLAAHVAGNQAEDQAHQPPVADIGQDEGQRDIQGGKLGIAGKNQGLPSGKAKQHPPDDHVLQPGRIGGIDALVSACYWHPSSTSQSAFAAEPSTALYPSPYTVTIEKPGHSWNLSLSLLM